MAHYDLTESRNPVLAVAGMEFARLAFGMCHVSDKYVVPYRVVSIHTLNVRLAAHLHKEVIWVEAETLEFALDVQLLIPEQL